MNKKKVKGMITKIVITGIVLFLVYYVYIVVDTQNVMQDIKQAATGGEIDNPVYNSFEPFHNTTSQKIRRYFTWCWGSQGEIWLGYEIITKFPDRIAKNGEYCSVIIEKREGKWEATKVKFVP